jgi:hypothetical protein
VASLALPVAPRAVTKYSPEDRAELADIVRDAHHPVVEQTTALVDEEFNDVRKEILMSVVDEQAEQIAQEAAESGALDALGPAITDQAVAKRRATSAAATAEPVDVERAAQPAGGNDPMATGPSLGAELEEEIDEAAKSQTASAMIDDALAAAEAELAQVKSLVDALPGSAADPPVRTPEQSEPKRSELETGYPTGDPISSPAEGVDVDGMHPSDRAERVLADIETGIRKLACLLSGEINEQWHRAREAFDEVRATSAQAHDANVKAATMIQEIARLRAEAAIARDAADVARREAELLREDARLAKNRADASATAAELSANQAGKEANVARERAAIAR